MMKFADLIEEHTEELTALDTIDAGKLFYFGKVLDIPSGSATIRYYAGTADKIHGNTIKMNSEMQAYTLKEPIGVVGHIIPWNYDYPTQMFDWKVGPALAAGCTMVVKPAQQTPLSALYYAHLAKLAGIPDGVINGFGHTAGVVLCSHMDVDMACFTGSTETGRHVMQAAAMSNLKPVSLELGGKSPVIIFDDVDVDKAVDLALVAAFVNKEVDDFVQEGIYDDFIRKLQEQVKSWVVGDLFDPEVAQGPQIDKNQYEKVLSYIELGKKEGATLLMGGEPCEGKGFYIKPTIFTDDDMTIAKEEIFGPVMSILKLKTVDEAIKRANATKYGLAAGIMTDNLNIANTVSRSLNASIGWINCYFAFDYDLPFGGFKMSGFGKDAGLEALDKYLQVKSVATPIYNSPWL
ncbi:dehydrogenase [Lithospermum erythrorhizon]|uniref:Dehydrogenase n=1 Tax=Lithospermum erythrorhizon TaxID=34254 RepID=A0AAV3NZ06_LITER